MKKAVLVKAFGFALVNIEKFMRQNLEAQQENKQRQRDTGALVAYSEVQSMMQQMSDEQLVEFVDMNVKHYRKLTSQSRFFAQDAWGNVREVDENGRFKAVGDVQTGETE